MSRKNRIAGVVFLVSSLIAAATYAGAPLKGVDVKLGKMPGGGAAARTTDEHGTVNFGVVPKGEYALTFAGGDGSTSQWPTIAAIEIRGAEGGAINAHWDLKQGRRHDPASGSASRKAGDERIVLHADGKTPVTVTVSKSDAKNAAH